MRFSTVFLFLTTLSIAKAASTGLRGAELSSHDVADELQQKQRGLGLSSHPDNHPICPMEMPISDISPCNRDDFERNHIACYYYRDGLELNFQCAPEGFWSLVSHAKFTAPEPDSIPMECPPTRPISGVTPCNSNFKESCEYASLEHGRSVYGCHSNHVKGYDTWLLTEIGTQAPTSSPTNQATASPTDPLTATPTPFPTTTMCPERFEEGEWCNVDPTKKCSYEKSSAAVPPPRCQSYCIDNKWSRVRCTGGGLFAP